MNAEQMLIAARSRIRRSTPEETAAALEEGAIVIDLRCADERSITGVIPGSIPIARSVLEWRCDPESEWRDRRVARPDSRVILVCADGFSSSLAADSLRILGFADAGDLAGGMSAWLEAGLPVER
ncbi:MAG TPA: rhodanese-like domain-containing protein [Acidimicrobiia bacterium]|nr:rhodanese-like domain-containing protein [Acidimicrobiia bacterium]